MVPTQVALVPYDVNSPVGSEELMHVAAALQIQVVRDLMPVWGVTGAVSSFNSLEVVPPGYFPVAIINEDLPLDRHGFHFAMAGLPFALVQYVDGWSLAASHETMEMICDPYGERTTLGPSLADAKHRALSVEQVIEGQPDYASQGQVEYLVEICDPCEYSTYKINGVLVSDFVTPAYYNTVGAIAGAGEDQLDNAAATGGADCCGYTFMGQIKQPLGLLEGGYISWRTRLSSNAMFQASGAADPDSSSSKALASLSSKALASAAQNEIGPAAMRIVKLSDIPSSLSRDSVGSQTPRQGLTAGSAPPPYTSNLAWRSFGTDFRTNVDALVTWLKQQTQPARPSRQNVIDLLTWFKGKNTPSQEELTAALARHNIAGVPVPDDAQLQRTWDQLQKNYPTVIDALQNQNKISGLFGSDPLDPSTALWMCMLIGG